jgi:hypothetical protein
MAFTGVPPDDAAAAVAGDTAEFDVPTPPAMPALPFARRGRLEELRSGLRRAGRRLRSTLAPRR